MNFYEFNEKLKLHKESEAKPRGIIGTIGQNFKRGMGVLNKSLDQGWQQVDQMQNAQQNRIDGNQGKNLETHLSQLIKKMGIDPNNLQGELKSLVSKIEELKAKADAEAKPTPTASPADPTIAPPAGTDWSTL